MSRRRKKNAPLAATLDNLKLFNPLLPLLLGALATLGGVMLVSAAKGDPFIWAIPHMARFAVGLALMTVIALIDIRIVRLLALPAYAASLLPLLLLEFQDTGAVNRWISIGGFRLQPSEIMKITLVLVLADYFHRAPLTPKGGVSFLHLLAPAALIAAPFALILRQPDLGTALVTLGAGIVIVFLAGIHRGWFIAAAAAAPLAAWIGWVHFLRPYQRDRILTFLDPTQDPLGSGYHTIQSITAVGSGGTYGLGYMEGMHSHLDFLPEKETDFIFTMFAEEFGFVGGIVLLSLYALTTMVGVYMTLRCRHRFGRLLIGGVFSVFFMHAAINIAMATGMFPIVGLPLPLISHGGTSLLSLMIGFGLAMNAYVRRDAEL